jgi:hypothetical protein
MQQASLGRSAPVAAILAIVGGALLAIGSFLAWASVSGGGTSVTAKGTDGSDGYITLVAGIVVIACGVLLLRVGKKAIAVLAIVAALIGGAVGLYDALTAKDRVLDDAAEELATQFGATASEVRTLLDQAIDAGQISISLSVGLYMVIAGGVLGLVGGILGLRGAGPEPVAAAAFGAPESAGAFGSSMPAAAPPMPADPPPMPGAPPSDAGGQDPGGP